MFEMMARDITAPYSAAESWIYDRFIAPAVNDYVREAQRGELDGLPGGARVLDVGCGGGQNACWFAEARADLRVTGLDLSPQQIGRARRRGRGLADRVEFVEGSALDLPFDDHSFDLVVSMGSIKHWPDQARGVAECARVLAPGGQLIIAEADRGCRLDDARAFVDRWRVPHLLWPLALAGFRTWVAGQGLDADDGRALLAAHPELESRVERIAGAPFLVLHARRPAA